MVGKRSGGDLIEDAAELLLEVVKVLEPVGEENVVDFLFAVSAGSDVVGGGLLLRVGGAGVVRIVVLLDGVVRESVKLHWDPGTKKDAGSAVLRS